MSRAPGSATDYSYDDAPGGSGSTSVRWNAIALVGRQGIILVASVILARLLGPTAYGIVAQANVYIALTTLLLDQGLTAALISQKKITRDTAGAAATVNLGLAVVFILVTVPLAGPVASFLNTPELVSVLPVLALGLILKSIAIVPRMLLMRTLNFKSIAYSDVGSAVLGGVLGILAALLGFGYWAIVVQLVASDLLAAIILYVAARPPLPNLRMRALGDSIGFGTRVFIGNLIAFASRNIDNVLVGKFFGSQQLGYYSLAYKVLLTPIQMVGQVVTRVLFPAISRVRDNHAEVSRLILRSTRGISFIAFPLMAFIGVSAEDTIGFFLGASWLPAVLVLQVLSVTGARQAVTAVNAPVLLGLNRSDIHLRFNIAAAIVQIAGMIAGLPWGIVGVAVGYTIAGILLTPVIFHLQKKLVGMGYRSQLGAIAPAFHASLWAIIPYALLYLVPMLPIVRIVVGAVIFFAVFALVMRVVHRRVWKSLVADGVSLLPKRARR
ncbi:lipopolysaccharide biosynthesis protein [Subtercola sp. Z020]|uniref:lipopolysaccharide biosynthesis protein n=1 Tax=Subtercola sp. Z020 TaxID=2080582 RepID=UPI00130EE2F0|nr:lipopolysaccharide biosynthesis protein [Subtercola sp. Z020]